MSSGYRYTLINSWVHCPPQSKQDTVAPRLLQATGPLELLYVCYPARTCHTYGASPGTFITLWLKADNQSSRTDKFHSPSCSDL